MGAVSVVSVGDLSTPGARAKRADWMTRYDVGTPPAPHPRPVLSARPVPIAGGPPALPRPVAPQALDLVGPAAAAGWHVELFYSRGTVLLATGKRGRLADVTSVRGFRFPDEFVTITWYRFRTDWEAGDGWAWSAGQRPRAVGVGIAKGLLGGRDEPDPLDRVESTKGACQVCAAMVTLNKDGTLRVHGPKADRCHGSRRIPLSVSSSIPDSSAPLPS